MIEANSWINLTGDDVVTIEHVEQLYLLLNRIDGAKKYKSIKQFKKTAKLQDVAGYLVKKINDNLVSISYRITGYQSPYTYERLIHNYNFFYENEQIGLVTYGGFRHYIGYLLPDEVLKSDTKLAEATMRVVGYLMKRFKMYLGGDVVNPLFIGYDLDGRYQYRRNVNYLLNHRYAAVRKIADPLNKLGRLPDPYSKILEFIEEPYNLQFGIPSSSFKKMYKDKNFILYDHCVYYPYANDNIRFPSYNEKLHKVNKLFWEISNRSHMISFTKLCK